MWQTRPAVASETILVVDDDASIRLLCRINLELDGYRVFEAASPGEARAVIHSEDVDAVLLDVHLRAADDLALAGELRTEHPDLGIVLMTGSADTVGKSVRFDAVLPKPFELESLRAAVARAAAAGRRSV